MSCEYNILRDKAIKLTIGVIRGESSLDLFVDIGYSFGHAIR